MPGSLGLILAVRGGLASHGSCLSLIQQQWGSSPPAVQPPTPKQEPRFAFAGKHLLLAEQNQSNFCPFPHHTGAHWLHLGSACTREVETTPSLGRQGMGSAQTMQPLKIFGTSHSVCRPEAASSPMPEPREVQGCSPSPLLLLLSALSLNKITKLI